MFNQQKSGVKFFNIKFERMEISKDWANKPGQFHQARQHSVTDEIDSVWCPGSGCSCPKYSDFVSWLSWFQTDSLKTKIFSWVFTSSSEWILVGGIPTPSENCESVGMMKCTTEWKNNIHVPNYQPVIGFSQFPVNGFLFLFHSYGIKNPCFVTVQLAATRPNRMNC